MQDYLKIIAEGGSLSQPQAEAAMHQMMRGEASPEHIAGFLMGLRARGETFAELVGFTKVMREYAVTVDLDDPHAIDLCGTGGDGLGTFNISTAAAFVCAGAGVTVAKHGNRSISSRSGSADVMEALGVRADLDKPGVERCLREAGIAFIYAPRFHPAMKHVMGVRRSLGVRTFFNILGPLCNPARVSRQLVGAFSDEVAQTMGHILAELGSEHVIAVHAEDGLDEISLAGHTNGYEYRRALGTPDRLAALKPRDIRPELHGLAQFKLTEIRGGTAEENARIIRDVLAGTWGPHRIVVLLNAAYALLASGKFDGIDACIAAARASIDEGRAAERLAALAEVSNAAVPAT